MESRVANFAQVTWMIVFFALLDGSSLFGRMVELRYQGQTVEVDEGSSMDALSVYLSKIFKIPLDEQHLVTEAGKNISLFEGQLKDCLDKADSYVDLSRVNPQLETVIVKNLSSDNFEFVVNRKTSLLDLQKEIEKRFRIPVGLQEISIQGTNRVIDYASSLVDQVEPANILYVGQIVN